MPVSSSLSRLQAHSGSHSSDGKFVTCQGYAISVQEDDAVDADRKERRRKKKRRRSGVMRVVDMALLRRIWTLKFHLLALSAVFAIVVYEVRHLSQHRPSSTNEDSDATVKEDAFKLNETTFLVSKGDDEKRSSLNNMAMPLRTVGGRKEPCLNLLPSQEIDKLKFPELNTTLVKVLKYVTRKAHIVDREMEEGPMASPFAGFQTMEERARSFQVREEMEVHCGFCKEGSGFEVDAEDESYMGQCIIVVVTCTFGGGDDLYQPIGMTNASLSRVCYVALWDTVTLEAQTLEGKAPDTESRKVGLWRIVVVKNLPFSDQRRNGKIPKMLNHRLFPRAKYSIWVDSKSQFRRDPIGVLEALLLRPKLPFAISEHGGRSCIYKEGEAIVNKHKALPREVAVQLDQYRSENIPERAMFDGHKALSEASVIVREHTPLTNLFMCLWFNEVMRFTARDQLSFPYVLLRLQLMHVNSFPVCTRRALVNSLGHSRKAKPLAIK